MSENTTVPFLARCFNNVLLTALIPKMWTRAVIIPLHKKGKFGKPKQLSSLSVISKCYTRMLNTRMKEWMEENGKNHRTTGGL